MNDVNVDIHLCLQISHIICCTEESKRWSYQNRIPNFGSFGFLTLFQRPYQDPSALFGLRYGIVCHDHCLVELFEAFDENSTLLYKTPEICHYRLWFWVGFVRIHDHDRLRMVLVPVSRKSSNQTCDRQTDVMPLDRIF
jgi:hypothetical protein